MEWNEILIRYGEISLKGRNRSQFIRKLKNNITSAMRELKSIHIRAERDRMFLIAEESDDLKKALERLPHVFGIQSFSPVAQCKADLETIKRKAVEVIGSGQTEGKTFKVEVKRQDKDFPMVTSEIQREVGGYVLSHFPDLIVQMKKPDIVLLVDIRKEGAFLTSEVIKGAGGMPVGSNGNSLLMLSGGIDSPVAGYQMMKRGMSIDAIHFASPPYTSELAQRKVMDLAEKLCSFGATVRLHIIPFTELQQAVVKQIPANISMTTTRRMMLQVADRVREEIKAHGIITGESLGQVASQTLESMTAINEVTSTPILRPLIAMDKLEIIAISQQIGTYDISIRPYEDCCTIFTPSSPKTKPKLEKVHYYESFLDFSELIEEAVKNRTVIEASELHEDVEVFDDLL